jgi:hypothetical protein
MPTKHIYFTVISSALISSTAFPLGLELELGGNIGKEKFESRTKTTTTTDSEQQSARDDLSNPLVFGGRFDGRLLFIHNRNLNLSAGAGLGWESASSDVSLNGVTVELSYNRLILEPNAKLTYFATRDFAITAGMGYYLGLTGSQTSIASAESVTEEKKQDIKDDGAFRLRLGGSFVLSGTHRPQFQLGYQLTAGGTVKFENSDKLDLSGHSFIVSYVHPIIFGSSEMETEDDYVDRPQWRRGNAPMNDKNQRRRKQRQRTEQ